MQEYSLDTFDFKILDALAKNGRLTNLELGEIINLSASQCSRRRVALEETGIIQSYHATINRAKLGKSLISFTSLTLAKHSGEYSAKFKALVDSRSEIEEAFTLTGNYDYLLKIAVKDLKALSQFINDILLAQENISQVHSSIVLEALKER